MCIDSVQKKTVKGRNKEVTSNSHNCGFELYNILKFHVQIIQLDIYLTYSV